MRLPDSVAAFLAGKRLAVAGVSRDPQQAANVIFRRLRDTGHEVYAINPNATEVEGVPAYPDVGSLPAPIDGLLIATHPRVAADLVRQCDAHGVRQVWFHRSVGAGSVSPEAVRECEARGIRSIVGGCPLMYCGRVDPAHRGMEWLLRLFGRVPRPT